MRFLPLIPFFFLFITTLSAQEKAAEAMTGYEEAGPEQGLPILIGLIESYATNYPEDAIRLAIFLRKEAKGKHDFLARSFLAEGIAFDQLDDKDNAFASLKKAVAESKKAKNEKIESDCYLELVKIYGKHKGYKSALSYHELFLSKMASREEAIRKEMAAEANTFVEEREQIAAEKAELNREKAELEADKLALEQYSTDLGTSLQQTQHFLDSTQQKSKTIQKELSKSRKELASNTERDSSTIINLQQEQIVLQQKQLDLERENSEASAQIQKQKAFKNILLIAIISALLLATQFFLRYLQKQRANAKLKEQGIQITEKNEELHSTLENLKSAQTQLVESEKMASLGQLTAGVAHEINNPINFVTGNISPLKRDIKDIASLFEMVMRLPEAEDKNEAVKNLIAECENLEADYLFREIDELLNGIEEGALRTKEIVAGLRNFSRLDEDDFKLADIHEGIESTLLILKTKIKDRIEITKDFEKLPEIECLPGKLNQVFMNIINNAADAIKEKGSIHISTQREKDKIRIDIKDSGAGMSPEVQKRIFEPFFTTKDVGSGTGLGLSISYSIIEKHGGKLSVKSKEGEGSTFSILLPLERKEGPKNAMS